MSPVNIWIFSFTRTAVQEIRDRVGDFLEDAGLAYDLKISTIDSGMWNLTSGFGESAAIGDQSFSGYDLNIQKAIEILERRDEGVMDFFHEMEHIIIDEAQDVEEARSDLMEKILSPEPCLWVYYSRRSCASDIRIHKRHTGKQLSRAY